MTQSRPRKIAERIITDKEHSSNLLWSVKVIFEVTLICTVFPGHGHVEASAQGDKVWTHPSYSV